MQIHLFEDDVNSSEIDKIFEFDSLAKKITFKYEYVLPIPNVVIFVDLDPDHINKYSDMLTYEIMQTQF